MTGKFPRVPKLQIPLVDVRDAADAHVNAIEKGVGGTRYLINYQDEFSPFLEFSNILLEEFKGTKYKIPSKEAPYCLIWIASICDKRLKPMLPMWGKKFKMDRRKSIEELGLHYIPLKTSLVEMAHNLIDLGYFEDLRNAN